MPNISDKDLLQIIGSIYDAAHRSSADGWSTMYSEMADLLGCGPGAISLGFPELGTFDFISHNLDPECIREFRDHYQDLNPFRDKLLSMRPGDVFIRANEMADEEYVQTEFYRGFMQKYDFFNCRYEVLFEKDNAQVGIFFTRPRSDPAFNKDINRAIDFIIPHLRRAFSFYFYLLSVNREKKAMAEAFDRIPQCVLIVDRDQRLVFANNSGRELINREDGIEVGRDGRLKTWFRSDQRRLNAGLENVSSGVAPGPDGYSGFIQISRPSGGRPLAIMMSRFMNEGLAGLEHQRQLAILFISDLEQDPKAVEDVLSQIHGLTAAEARVASLLADGRSLNEICKILEIKQNTARSHLKQVFSKTGTSRQGELVKLILSGPANLK